MDTTELISKHKKSIGARLNEWLEYHKFTPDGRKLISLRLMEMKFNNYDRKSVWATLECAKKDGIIREFKESEFNKLMNATISKLNEANRKYPLNLNESYQNDLFYALIEEAKLSPVEKEAIVRAFILAETTVDINDYSSAIVKLENCIKNLDIVESFDADLFNTIFEANESALVDLSLVNEEEIKPPTGGSMDKFEEDPNAKKEREKENQEIQDKNKEEFEKANIARAKAKNAPFAKAMRAQGMSQDEAAAELGVHKSTISRIKTGKRRPSFELLQKISEKFGSVENLFPQLT